MSESIGILHIDDDPDIAEVTAQSLERINDSFEFTAVHSTEPALDRIEAEQFDCIVIDYDMPGMTGIDLLEQIRDTHPELPVIIFTGKGSEEVAAEALAGGATDYVPKQPGSGQFQVLANRIENAVERFHATIESERAQRHREQLLDRITDGYVHLDTELTILDANEATASFADIPREELIGTDYLTIIQADADSTLIEAYETVLETREPRSVEVSSAVHPDRWVQERIFPADEGGIFVFFQDITEQKERQQALQKERDRLSAIYDAVPEPLVNTRYENGVPIVQRVNQAFEDTFGVDAETAQGQSINELIVPPEYLDEARELDASGTEQEYVTDEVWRQTTDGLRLFRFSASAVAQFDSYTEWIATYIDITDRKLREETLETQRENLEQLHAAANRLYTADTIDACYGITIDAGVSILGFDWCTLAAPADDGEMMEIKAISEGTPLSVGDRPFGVDEGLAGEVYQRKESKIVRDVRSNGDAKPTSDVIRSVLTVPVGDWGIMQAISTDPDDFDENDRRHAELLVASMLTAVDRISQRQELERQRDRLNEFASVVSHDLRNPLSIAHGHIELAREIYGEEHLEEAAIAIDRMDAMIDDLLTLAREGETVGDRETFDLGGLVEACWNGLDVGNATLVTEQLPSIHADRERVRQLLENLIRNAVEHTGPTPIITIGGLADGFFVEDDGPGIPDEHVGEVFKPGFSTATDGNGFGLSIVKRIVDAHGWEIVATSGDDGGARFEVTGVDIS